MDPVAIEDVFEDVDDGAPSLTFAPMHRGRGVVVVSVRREWVRGPGGKIKRLFRRRRRTSNSYLGAKDQGERGWLVLGGAFCVDPCLFPSVMRV